MLTVLYEDNHCLAVSKPAGMIVQGGRRPPALLDEARAYLKHKYHKPGNVFLGVVHRLDTPVSGVVLLARTSKAAGRLSEQFRRGTVEKVYWAFVELKTKGTRQARRRNSRSLDAHAVRHPPVVPPVLPEALVTWQDYLLKDPERNVVRVVPPGTPHSKLAVLDCRPLAQVPGGALVELHLLTGRSHQIRAQLAARNLPIYGDLRYGATHSFWAADDPPAVTAAHRPRAIALHARRLTVEHPVRHEPLMLEAPLPHSWRRLIGSWQPP